MLHCGNVGPCPPAAIMATPSSPLNVNPRTANATIIHRYHRQFSVLPFISANKDLYNGRSAHWKIPTEFSWKFYQKRTVQAVTFSKGSVSFSGSYLSAATETPTLQCRVQPLLYRFDRSVLSQGSSHWILDVIRSASESGSMEFFEGLPTLQDKAFFNNLCLRPVLSKCWIRSQIAGIYI